MILNLFKYYYLVVFVAVVTVTNLNAPAHAGNTHSVEISNFTFAPANIKVRTGDTIVFINRDIVPHTATAVDDSWDTGEIASGESRSIVVQSNMTLAYYCFYHQAMKGVLIKI